MNWSDIKEAVGKVAPVAGGLLGGPAGGAIGGLIASALGVEAKPQTVLDAIANDASALIKLREIETTHTQQMTRLHIEAETARLSEINQTMRAETAANDAFVRRWRPMFGYAVALTWVVQTLAIACAMVISPASSADIINAIVALTPMWGIALAVLGVNVQQRSKDKQVTAGMVPTSIFNALKKQ